MKNYYGFTLIEVVVAIFVFSSGMMAFMAYHARANTMIFETESSQIAHALGLNLIEEINSMTPARFSELADKRKMEVWRMVLFIRMPFLKLILTRAAVLFRVLLIHGENLLVPLHQSNICFIGLLS